MASVKRKHMVLVVQVLLLWVTPLDSSGEASLTVKQETSIQIMNSGNINFRSPVIMANYLSSVDFDPRGMEHLYEITNYFLHLVQKPGLPEGIIKEEIFVDPLGMLRNNKGKLLSHFVGMILVAIIGVVLAVVVPISGFMFCCCRCTGHCGDKDSLTKRRKDPCHQAVLGTLMSTLLLIMMFGVVCAFVTNEYMDQGLHTLPGTLTQSLDDIHLYLNNTKIEVKVLLKTNFQQLQQKLEESLNRSGYTVKTRLGEVSKAVAVDNLTEIVSNLKQIHADLSDLVNNTHELDKLTSQLQFGLRDIRRSFSDLLQRCTASTCDELKQKYDLANLVVNVNMKKLPNVTALLHNVSALLQADIEKEVKKGKIAFDGLSEKIQDAVSSTIPDIKRQIEAVGKELSLTADEVVQALQLPRLHDARKLVDETKFYLLEYSAYRWYLGIGFSCGILVITLCFACGLACGFCGKSSGNMYSDSSCNKGSGANLLLMGVVLIFLFFFQFLITITAFFLLGGIAEQVFCNWMENMSDPQFQKLIMLSQKQLDVYIIRATHPDFTEMLRRCHSNTTLYRTLELDKYNNIQLGTGKVLHNVNVSSIIGYKERYSVDKKLNEFLQHLNVNPGVTLLTPEGQQLLEKLKDTPISSVNFTSYASLVQQDITPVNLFDVAQELYRHADSLAVSDLQHASELRNIALQLESYQSKLIIPVASTIENLKTSAKKLEQDCQYSSRDLQDALTELIDQAHTAQEFIHTSGRDELKKVAKGFVDEFTSLLDDYAVHVIHQVNNEIGKCGPVSQAVNSTVVAVCKEIVLPFNGFWVSVGLCLMVCIPCLWFGIFLSVLYRRIDRYCGPLIASSNRKHAHSEDIVFDNHSNYLQEYGSSYQDQLGSSPANFLLPNGHYPSRNRRSKGEALPLETADWHGQRPVTDWSSLPEYSRPPPYYHPGS